MSIKKAIFCAICLFASVMLIWTMASGIYKQRLAKQAVHQKIVTDCISMKKLSDSACETLTKIKPELMKRLIERNRGR